MRLLTLTGISKKVLNELIEYGIKTIEIRSAHNLYTLMRANPGDLLFLTYKSYEDITPGTEGVIARLRRKELGIRKCYGIEEETDECETIFARIQVEFVNVGRVIRPEEQEFGREFFVYLKVTFYEIS